MKLALFISRPTVIYATLYFAIKRGFEALGVVVEGGPFTLPDPVMAAFCREFQPDLVMELDRTRCHLPSLPSHIPHVAWILDLVNRHGGTYQGSDILYGADVEWFTDARAHGAKIAGWLPPGYGPETYYYQELPWESDFSFVGHLSAPWSESELARPVGHLTFGQLHQRYFDRLVAKSPALPTHPYMDWPQGPFAILDEVLAESGLGRGDLDQSMFYDLTSRLMRMFNRSRFLNRAMDVSPHCRFYGSGGWLQWPRFAPLFQGYVQGEQVRRVYQTTRINLHDGNLYHFRPLDCLAAGGFLFHRDTPFTGNRFLTTFEKDKHYVAVNDENFDKLARHYLNNPEERRAIARQGALEVQRNHSWRKRAETILQDVERVRCGMV